VYVKGYITAYVESLTYAVVMESILYHKSAYSHSPDFKKRSRNIINCFQIEF